METTETVEKKLRIGTRGSRLALAQTALVEEALRSAWPGLETETVILRTKGDRVQDKPLSQVGQKGVFVAARLPRFFVVFLDKTAGVFVFGEFRAQFFRHEALHVEGNFFRTENDDVFRKRFEFGEPFGKTEVVLHGEHGDVVYMNPARVERPHERLFRGGIVAEVCIAETDERGFHFSSFKTAAFFTM